MQSIIAALLVIPMAYYIPAVPVRGDVHNWFLFALVLVLASLLAGSLGLVIGSTVNPKQIGLVFSIIVVPITFLGCVYYPWAWLDKIPWLQYGVLFNPIVYMSEGLRAAVTPGVAHMPWWAILRGAGLLHRRAGPLGPQGLSGQSAVVGTRSAPLCFYFFRRMKVDRIEVDLGTVTMRRFFRILPLLLAPALLLAAGCGNGLVTANSSNPAFSVTPGTALIDTNCTGCNATSAQGASVHQFTATLSDGGPAEVIWSVSGGDAAAGREASTPNGQYTPPSYLTADRVEVVVTATLAANPSLRAYSVLTVTPGFLQPLTPENVALGANGSVTDHRRSGRGGRLGGINFELAGSANGQGGGQGSLGAVSCQRDSKSFTSCTVTYTAPASVQATGVNLRGGHGERLRGFAGPRPWCW